MARRLAVFGTVLALAMAACGDDDDAADTTGPAATEPAPAATTGGTDAPADGGGDAVTMTISGFAFPAETAAAPGATVTIVNEDAATHTVTSPDGAFNVEVGSGATVELELPTEPGTYDFVCNFHSGMSGAFVVG